MTPAGSVSLGLLRLATGGDVGFDGDRIAIRAYTDVFLWPRPPGTTVAQALAGERCSAPEGTEAQGEAIAFPEMAAQVDYEAELGIVIKDTVRSIAPQEAHDHILGYTCVNDVTARDLQRKDGQWTRAKSFDTFCPVGPWIETDLDPKDLAVESFLNGEQRQASRTSQFIFPVDVLVSFISKIMTLFPGDLILTGTPAGIGPMKPGDEIEVRIEGIGSLKNTVQK